MNDSLQIFVVCEWRMGQNENSLNCPRKKWRFFFFFFLGNILWLEGLEKTLLCYQSYRALATGMRKAKSNCHSEMVRSCPPQLAWWPFKGPAEIFLNKITSCFSLFTASAVGWTVSYKFWVDSNRILTVFGYIENSQ